VILVIHSYPKANFCFDRHFPYWRRCGFTRIIGVATKGGGCKFSKGVDVVEIGRDVYIDGDALPRRWTDTAEWMLTQRDWDDAVIINADTVLFKPMPSVVNLDGFHAQLAGELDYKGEKRKFYHNPVLCNRRTWELLLKCGRQMLEEGDIAEGLPDFWAGRLCQRFSIPVHTNTFYGYTRNTIETYEQIQEAAEAYRAGAVAIHGIKSAKVLAAIVPANKRFYA
jgi:hypothetical protein